MLFRIGKSAGIVAGAVSGTEKAAACSFGTVTVGTGEPAVKGEFSHFTSEMPTKPDPDVIEVIAAENIFHLFRPFPFAVRKFPMVELHKDIRV